MWTHHVRRLSSWLPLAVILAFGLWIVSPIFGEGLPFGYDDSAYVVRSWFIRDRIAAGFSFDWCPYWYAGFPTVIFYPFIIEVFTAFTSLISGISILWAFKIVVALMTVLPAITLFLLAREWFDEKAAFTASMLLLLMPHYTDFVGTVGLRVFTFGFALMPLQLLLFDRVIKAGGRAYTILCGLLLGVLIAFHALSAYTSVLVMGFYIIIYSLKRRNLQGLFKIVKQSILILLIGLGISAFWLLPYVTEINYSWAMRRIFQAPEQPIEIISSFPIVYGLIPTLCAALGILCAVKRRRFEHVLLLSWMLLFLLISFGPHGFIWQMLPLQKGLEYLRFENYLIQPLTILAGIFVSEAVAASTKIPSKLNREHRRALAAILIISMVFGLSVIFAPMSLTKLRAAYATQDISNYPEFNTALEWLKGREMTGRTLVHINMCDSGPTSYAFRESTIAYLPFLTGKPLFYGHMHAESSLLSNYTVWLTHNTPLNPVTLYNALRVGNVEYIMLGKESSPELFKLLNSSANFTVEKSFSGFQTIYFFKLNYDASLVEVPDSVAFLITKDDDLANILFNDLLKREGGYRPIIVRGASEYIDDYSLTELKKFDAIIHDERAYRDLGKTQNLLQNFKEASGTVINLTTYEPDQILSLPQKKRTAQASYNIIGDSVVINVSNAQPYTPILLKFSYFPRWEASYQGDKLKIYEAIPGLMLVFLEETGKGEVKFSFVWRSENYIGALASTITFGLCAILLVNRSLGKLRRRWP